MKLILISYPENISSEHDIMIQLFEEGLEYFHLRKPGMSSEKMYEYIKKIPQKYHNRIVLHSNIELLLLFDLKGIHFTHETNHLINIFSDYDGHKSISCHSLNEIKELQPGFGYAFLSPLFNSISKIGYLSKFSLSEVGDFLSAHNLPSQVIALGGVDEEQIIICKELGFEGIAILGSLWEPYLMNKDRTILIEKFLQFKERCKQPVHM